MPPEEPAHPERDEPLDAFVYDVHPALRPQREYPYGAPAGGENPFQDRPVRFYWHAQALGFRAAMPAKYKVPQRFGMSAILGIMTALALLFGGLRLLNADPVVYLFFGVQALIICVVQMFHGGTPRFASSIAGAIILPVFIMLMPWFVRRGPPWEAILCMLVSSVPIGAFLGYLTGTCAAGIFLVMDALEPYLQGQRPASSSSAGGT